jgi:Domain of unknown function (DUF4160)
MPEISRFYGIVIQLYYADHPPPHFHVSYEPGATPQDHARTQTSAKSAIHPEALFVYRSSRSQLPPGRIRSAKLSPSQLDALLEYVETQEEHYRSRTLSGRTKRGLRKHGVEYAERYALGRCPRLVMKQRHWR